MRQLQVRPCAPHARPITLTPDSVYGFGTNPLTGGAIQPVSYNNTSYDTTGQVLKYRSQHLFRFDAELRRPKWFLGFSARYQSALQNIDQAWLGFEQSSSDLNWGLEDWLEEHSRFNYRTGRRELVLPWVFDMRLGWNVTDHHKLSLVVSNLTNAEYSIRPLAIESPRLVNVVYTYELQ